MCEATHMRVGCEPLTCSLPAGHEGENTSAVRMDDDVLAHELRPTRYRRPGSSRAEGVLDRHRT